MTVVADFVRLMRPRQWVKSGFVLIGVLFAHAWHDARTVRAVLLTVAAFSLVASGVYVFNDLRDRAQDAAHPRKRERALAVAPALRADALAVPRLREAARGTLRRFGRRGGRAQSSGELPAGAARQ